MVTIRQQWAPHPSKNTSVHPNDKRTITVHETGNRDRGAGAESHAKLQSRPNPRVASWHYQVDDTGAIQSFRHSVRTFHAGNALGNRESISVEICVNVDQDQHKAYVNGAELVAHIMRQEGIPLERVVQHHRYSGKDCPDGLRNRPPLYGMSWDQFMAHVRAAYSGTTTPTAPAPVTPTPPAVSPSAPSSGAPYAALLVDGIEGAVTIRAFQHLMAEVGYYRGRIDGVRGSMTVRAEQNWLRSLGHYRGIIDGQRGLMTRKARQAFLASKGLYAGRIDGIDGPMTIRAWQRYLNDQRKTWR